jgi:hypothetical protein
MEDVARVVPVPGAQVVVPAPRGSQQPEQLVVGEREAAAAEAGEVGRGAAQYEVSVHLPLSGFGESRIVRYYLDRSTQ